MIAFTKSRIQPWLMHLMCFTGLLTAILSGCSRTSKTVVYDFYETLPSAEYSSTRGDFKEAKQEFLNLQMDLRRFIDQPPGTTLSYYLQLPAQCTLEFGTGMDMKSWQTTGGVEVAVQLTPDGGTPRMLFSLSLNPWMNKDQSGWIDRRIDLSAYGGHLVKIDFLTRGLQDPLDESRVGWSHPRVTLKVKEQTISFSSRNRVQVEGRRADNVFWLILDRQTTAGPGAYGNPFSRTPNFDRFSRSAFTIEGCVTPSDHQIRALGSMLTGLYSSEHGLMKRGQRYKSGTKTIATHLSLSPTTSAWRSLFLTNRNLTTVRFTLSADFSDNILINEEITTGNHISPTDEGVNLIQSLDTWLTETRMTPRLVCIYPALSVLDRHSSGQSETDSFEDDANAGEQPTSRDTPPDELIAETNDRLMGKVLHSLQTHRLLDSGLVLISSLLKGRIKAELTDLGEVPAFNKLVGPLLMSFPAWNNRGKVLPVLVSGCDILPTLLAHLGVRPIREMSGTSLLPLLADRTMTKWSVPLFIDYLPARGSMIAEGHKINYFYQRGTYHYRVIDLMRDPLEKDSRELGSDFYSHYLCQMFKERFFTPLTLQRVDIDSERIHSAWFD